MPPRRIGKRPFYERIRKEGKRESEFGSVRAALIDKVTDGG
jgi:hypothetical protein